MIKESYSFLAEPHNSKLKWKKKKKTSLFISVEGPAIEINNLTAIRIKEGFFKKIAKVVLEGEKQIEKKLSIALVGQKKIRELNKKYRRKNRTTDVLAFPGNGLGEIIICLREVKKNAKRFESTVAEALSHLPPWPTPQASAFEKELARVLIHGILHLLGYDHEKNKQLAEKMKEKEGYYLLQLGT